MSAAPPETRRRPSLFGPANLHGGWRSAFWFLLPALVGFVAFYLYPALRGLYISFTDWNLIANQGSWVGTDNYDRLFNDRQVWESLKITFKYTVVNIGSQTILAVFIAVLMDRLTKSVTIRGILLLPWLNPNVIVALLWVWMLDGNLGIVNEFLGLFGMDPVRFFTDTGKVIPTLAGINTWRHMGYTALLIFAGLQTIPRSLYEAAAVDGATERQMFRDVTIPLLRPILALVLVITIVGSLQVFDTVFVATGGFGGQPGGPANASRVIYLYIYQNAFDFNQLGYAATISVLLVAILIVSVFPFWWALRTGLSTNGQLFAGEQSLLPVGYTDNNFERVLGTASEEEILESLGRQNTGSFDFLQSLKVSVIVSGAITVGQVAFSAMAAYAFARLRFRGRDKLFFLFLSGLMIPPIFTLIPNLILVKNFGWLNSYPGIIAPFFFMTPFAVFFLRQFFLGISREVEEAALLDGAGHFRTFFGIIVPMSAAPLATLSILTYITAWNEFLWPLVVARDPARQPLTVALGQFTAQQPGTSPDWSGLMAGTLLAALPIIVIFLAFGRKVVDSIGFSGIK